MSATQSASPVHAFAAPQQLVSRHESHIASPLPKPHALVDGGGPPLPPPHCAPQPDCMQSMSAFSFVAPVGCADIHAEMHASSLHASPHEMSALQSASETHAVFSAQQVASMHVSHVASPVERPHVPPPSRPASPPESEIEGFPAVFEESPAMVFASPPGRERASFDCQWLAEEPEPEPAVVPGPFIALPVHIKPFVIVSVPLPVSDPPEIVALVTLAELPPRSSIPAPTFKVEPRLGIVPDSVTSPPETMVVPVTL